MSSDYYLRAQNDIRFLSMLGVEEPIEDVLRKFMYTTPTEHIFVMPLKELNLSGFGENRLFITIE